MIRQGKRSCPRKEPCTLVRRVRWFLLKKTRTEFLSCDFSVMDFRDFRFHVDFQGFRDCAPS